MGELKLNYRETTIDELIFNFSNALNSIIPWIKKSHIPYLEGESYDDWDNISSVLFESIVVNSIQYSDEFKGTENEFAKYDFYYKNYRNLNYIICGEPSGSELKIFVSFCTDNFNLINTCLVDKDNFNVIARDKVEYSNLKFYVGSKKLYNKIKIVL